MKLSGYASIDKPWLKYYPRDVYESKLPEMTIYDYILEGNNFYPNRVALRYFNNVVTYGELIDNIDITARSFLSLGVKKGDIITISMPTLPEFIYMFYALSKIGAVANMIDPRKSSEEIEEYVNLVDSKMLVVVDVAASKVKSIRKNTNIKEIVYVSPSDSFKGGLKRVYNTKEKISGHKNYIKCKDDFTWNNFFDLGIKRKNKVMVETFPAYEKDRPVVIVYTGGTTGLSKGVVLSNDNVNCSSFQMERAGYDLQRQHKWLNIMPPFIAYGVCNGLHTPLRCGLEVILIPAFKPNEFDKLLYKYEPNHMTGVPTHYDTVLKSNLFKKKGLRFIYSPMVGGDKLDEASEVKINEFLDINNSNAIISKGYGLSEVSAGVCCVGDKRFNALGSVGIPFSHTTMAVFDPVSGKELKYNEKGEMCITGPNTMVSYYNNEEETKNILRYHDDGLLWCHSGDIGYIDEDGRIFIVGRMKEMIIRHDGFKVFPRVIEEAIFSHPSVKACKVVGVRDKNYSQGELPKAHVVLVDKDKKRENEIKKEIDMICKGKLAEYLQPCDYVFRDSLPLTKIGKIDFMALKKEEESNK